MLCEVSNARLYVQERVWYTFVPSEYAHHPGLLFTSCVQVADAVKANTTLAEWTQKLNTTTEHHKALAIKARRPELRSHDALILADCCVAV